MASAIEDAVSDEINPARTVRMNWLCAQDEGTIKTVQSSTEDETE